ncbi:MAG: methylenetetrahydrofolate dehydrogenase / methenyltetrahydrofolate cyclohydrolase [Patescibacteria group bacterium]|nr:methylenetetrahydrofolate dehydrogenase / methenyltetrahydrofolate cyclohydrolase [Patescibacteria group bacterium]
MKILDGLELSGYIKERQLKQVRALRQSWRVFPRLAIVHAGDNPIINTYMRLKCEYGKDIMIEVEVYKPSNAELLNQIRALNDNDDIHGIIVQLPLADTSQTEIAINAISSIKDVDGLTADSTFTPATALAINWLLAGYNINLSSKKVTIVGKGRLVGAPLAKLWKESEIDVTSCDINTTNLKDILQSSDVIVTATGAPGLITSSMVAPNAILVDAGTATEGGEIVGDLADDIRSRTDLTVTPKRGGVGPLTVSALFDNVILAARKIADQKGQQDNLKL